eukprot:gene29928-30412_t
MLLVPIVLLSSGGVARAADPAPTIVGLPQGVHQRADGRYAADLCDHGLRRHCMAQRLLPTTWRPGESLDLAPRPMEMVLLGTGGCTAYDVVLILKRGREDVRGCDVTLKAERADADPKVFTKIHFHFTVTGKNLKQTTVERAVSLSHDKYCSASIMLAKTAEITHSYEIVEG